MSEAERLQKYLSRMGIASRREAERMIAAGQVTINGKRAQLGAKVVGSEDIVVKGKRVTSDFTPVTFMLHKPRGYISTVKDTHKRKTIMHLVPAVKGLHPVGRLDAESEGLILLSNDGDLTLRLTHPRYKHKKEYRVWCDEGDVRSDALAQLKRGVKLEDGMARANRVMPAQGGCVIVLTEGRKRQVRRMLAAVGYRVNRLMRTRLVRLPLGNLPVGQYRELIAKDFERLES